MKLLVLTGPLYPQRSNNANLLLKLLPELAKKHTVLLAAPAWEGELPDSINGFPVHWLRDEKDLYRRTLVPVLGKLLDRHGHSDMVQALVLRRALKKLSFDAALCSMEPFPSALALYGIKNTRMFLYLMDPPAAALDTPATPLRKRMLQKLLSSQEAVLTTPFIRKALQQRGIRANFREVGFPMLSEHPIVPGEGDIPMPENKINLLFTGWLYSDIRSPKYFLEIAKHLDSRFRIVFMGRECELLRERFDFDTEAEVVTLPNQPYQTALNAMAGADVLINIGNSVPVHMPSKTLEYINARKPIVNFHKLPDCPTLHYTRRYPMCLNLFEDGTPDRQVVSEFIRFCLDNRRKLAPRPNIPECTPDHIARVLLDEIGE